MVLAVPAAAFVKSQLYVSTSFSHGAHFTDATLRDLLEASMQPDDNDLYLSNLVSIPILSIHGYALYSTPDSSSPSPLLEVTIETYLLGIVANCIQL